MATSWTATRALFARRTLPGQHQRWNSNAATTTTTTPQVPFRRDARGRLLSRVEGPREPPLLPAALYEHWTRLATAFHARPALVSKHEPASQHDVDVDVQIKSGVSATGDGDGDCLRWTYAELDAHISALARGLAHRLHLKRGDRVAVLMGNSSAYLALQWALAKLGAVLVPLNPAYAPDELGRSLAHVGARALVLVPSLKNADYLNHLARLLPGLRHSSSGAGAGARLNPDLLPELEHVVLVDNLTSFPKTGWERTSILARRGWSFRDALDALHGRALDYRSLLLQHGTHDDVRATLDAHDVINLQLTSGTTGLPKAVALTSYGMLNNGIAIGNVLHLRADDVVCNVPPLFQTFDPARTLAAVTEEKATALHGVPAMFFAIMDLLQTLEKPNSSPGSRDATVDALGLYDHVDIRTLRTGLISGASIPVELMSRLLDKLVPGLTSVYGMTETSPVSFGCDAVSTSVEHKAQTVGRVFPHVAAKIVRPLLSAAHHHEANEENEDSAEGEKEAERGTPLPVNTPGELCTSGYLLFKGYFNDPQRTQEVMYEHADEPGVVWMRTGDMAVMDEDGWVKIVGRCKDVIIRGGENLFPATIGNCVDEVEGVGQSAVIAVPDERLGETVGIFIKRASDAHGAQLTGQQIRAHVKARLSHQNAPDWVWMLGEDGVGDELPKTASGKVQN
ncbi:hypothetical protein OC834_005117, partial [Tilletia horrida]